MLKLETFIPGVALAPRFSRMLLAVFVATAVGAASAVGVIVALSSVPIGETQPTAMPTKGIANLAGASNSGIERQEPPPTSQWEPNNSSMGRARDSRAANSDSSRSQRVPAGASPANDGLSEVPRDTASNGAVTVTPASAERQERTHLDRRPPRLAIHRGRTYSRRFANTPFTSPLSRPW